jgi:hypothetical protein
MPDIPPTLQQQRDLSATDIAVWRAENNRAMQVSGG